MDFIPPAALRLTRTLEPSSLQIDTESGRLFKNRGYFFMLFFIVVHVLVTLALIGVIFLQKGEDAGGGKGGGLFTVRGARNPLSTLTAILAALFFLNCIVLAILVRRESSFHHKAPAKPAVPNKPIQNENKIAPVAKPAQPSPAPHQSSRPVAKPAQPSGGSKG
jgi:preprotein translocase subunit SecG